MADIFLSYSRDDQATARRFAEGFERAGWSVWWDQALHSGEDYDKVTEKALEEAKAVVVLWSRKSVDSRWVRAEATQADRNGTLVPAMIESCKRPIMFELKQTADLSDWTGDPGHPGWQTYLSSVRRLVEKGQPPQRDAVAPPPATVRPSRITRLAIAAGVGALLAIGGWWVESRKSPQIAPPPVAATNAVVTLAVLPFVNLSPDPQQEYFSDGLTEEILNQLAQIQALRVTGRTSSFSFKGKNEDLRVIGEKLGVANLLEGSIRKDGNQLRITAQLISSTDGSHQWSQTYARELKDVFAIQEEIAKDVAKALSIKLEVGDMSRALGGTTNLEAYEKYLRAQTLQRQWGESAFEAVQLYRDAIALDPTFWRAWYGLRDILGTARVLFLERWAEIDKEMNEVRAHLMKSAPDSWAKQAMLAGFNLEQRRWVEMDAAISAAMADMPASEVDARLTIALAQVSVGRVKDSLANFERAARIDPLTTSPSVLLQGALLMDEQYDESHAEFERGRTLSGSHVSSEWLELQRLLAKGDPQSISTFVRSSTASTKWEAPWKTLYERLNSAPAERKAAVRQALQDPVNHKNQALVSIIWFADAYDDRETTILALQELMKSNARGHPFLWQAYRTSPRTDPRFKEIVRDLGLVDYWRTTGNWGDFCKPVGTDDFECH